MRVVVAGTFGPLHDGHRALFEHALEFGSDGVLVAVTSDALAETTRHTPRPIPSFEARIEGVRTALEDRDRWNRSIQIERLDREPGLAATDPDVDALVVSPETADELLEINERRREQNLEPLTGIVAPYVLAEDGERISSTRIVAGEIDEHGRVLE
ncbi:MAG: pantetheine-phosphate adenylyltransferase [Natrialbaceae archaeon]|nr:pantetheine-phosphate adenylyltransferase [Natrialbaceae archaeon]